MNEIDVERVSNFLLFQRLIKDESIYQTFDNIISVLFDKKLKEIERKKFENLLVELFNLAI